MPIRQLLLNFGNRFTRIQVLGTHLGAVHNRVTSVQLEGIVEFAQTLGRAAVATVLNPPIGLHEDRRTQVLVGVPPVTGTGGGAAGAENALVHAVQFGAVLARLQVLGLTGRLGRRRLQPGFNRTVLLIEIPHVRHQVFDDVHVREGVDFGGFGSVLLVNVRETGQRVLSVNVHGAGSANSLATGTTKGECGILLVFDFDESVQNHGSAFVQIDGIGGEIRLLILFRIPSVHFEILDALGFVAGR